MEINIYSMVINFGSSGIFALQLCLVEAMNQQILYAFKSNDVNYSKYYLLMISVGFFRNQKRKKVHFPPVKVV